MESTLRDIVDLKVIETFRSGSSRLNRHLARAERTCSALGFAFDRAEVLQALDDLDKGDLRVRLTIARDGGVSVTSAPYTPLPEGAVWCVSVSKHRLDADAESLRVKTTARALYDQTRADLPEGVDEVIFANQRSEVCEGTITNIFADFGEGLVTPPVSSGLLPGILREELLETGRSVEAVVPLERLKDAQKLYVGNSLRGLIPARL